MIINKKLSRENQKKELNSLFEIETSLPNQNHNECLPIRSIEDLLMVQEGRKNYVNESEYEKRKKETPKSSLRYKKYVPKPQPSHIDQLTGALVFEVPSHELPPHVLGLYHIPSHTIYIANDLPSKTQNFVYHHEVGHALGISDDSKADDYAAQKVGYDL